MNPVNRLLAHGAIVAGLVLLSLPAPTLAGPESLAKAPWVGVDHRGRPCKGGDPRRFGPYDYRVHKDLLPVVEFRHFTPPVEMLQRGESTIEPIKDVDYTLVRFPNHHRALNTAITFSVREGESREGRLFPAECYLKRAINFQPDDPVPYMLYGMYLHRLDNTEEALDYYRRAEKLAPANANLLYNMGLVFFDKGDYQQAREYADRAYGQGITLPGLRRKLTAVGDDS